MRYLAAFLWVACAKPTAEPPSGTFRAIAGVSMGGFGAAHIGTAHPELFDVVGAHGGLVDMGHFLWQLETHFLGGFRAEPDLEFTFEALPGDPDVTLDRDAYVIDFFQDFSRSLGSFALFNPDSPYYPPTVTGAALKTSSGRGNPGVVVERCFDDEYNPSGALPAIPFYDGGDEEPEGIFNDPGDRLNKQVEVLLAIDLNRNGQRDAEEPVVRDFHEPYRDCGRDGLCAGEAGYPGPDTGEANRRFDDGEPWQDLGLDGVEGTVGTPCDFGEGNGRFDANPNHVRYAAADPLVALGRPGTERLLFWLDAGTEDAFRFDVETDRFAARVAELGGRIDTYQGFEALPSAEWPFDASQVDFSAIPGSGYVSYEGGHVGSAATVVARFTSLFYFLSTRFPDGDTRPTKGLCTTQVTTMPSSRLGRDLEYGLFLPPGYEASGDLRYPVAYFLHGYGQEPADLVGLLSLVLGPAMGEGKLQKLIVILPSGRTPDGHVSAFLDMAVPPEGDTGKYEEAIVHDLIPHIDRTYRTKGRAL